MSLSKNPYDVTFLVGAEKHQIKAHKQQLANISEVFDKMFYSDFNSEHIVEVPDITREGFQMMIDFAYGRNIDISTENMFDIMVVADKYQLRYLKTIGSHFVTKYVNADNALEIVNDFMRFNEKAINDECLAIICDNPLRYFNSPLFSNAEPEVVNNIVKSQCINCSTQDIKDALVNWVKTNKLKTATVFNDEVQKIVEADLQITEAHLDKKLTYGVTLRIDYFLNWVRDNALSTTFDINYVKLYGIGIVLGKNFKTLINTDTVTITITDGKIVKPVLRKIVTYDHEIPIMQNLFFEKILVDHKTNGRLIIQVQFMSNLPPNGTRAAFNLPDEDSTFISHLMYSKI